MTKEDEKCKRIGIDALRTPEKDETICWHSNCENRPARPFYNYTCITNGRVSKSRECESLADGLAKRIELYKEEIILCPRLCPYGLREKVTTHGGSDEFFKCKTDGRVSTTFIKSENQL
ncbi:MAG: hypothetical protein KKF68_02015 [Nanoarchaeota archaeon]|nr:hypothetical protein [Nanoarchaeota archaeon]